MMEKLWGDNFFDSDKKKWCKIHNGSSSCKRAFVQFIYQPIKTIVDAAMNDQRDKLFAMVDKLGINEKIKNEAKELSGKPLMKFILQSWIPAHIALLEMMVSHLPSPKMAQRYRYEILYEGPLNDIYSKSIKNCDSSGPMVMYVSKMIPTSD
jgi:elongation factor 2